MRASETAGLIFEEFLAWARVWDEELGVFGRKPEDFLLEIRKKRTKRANIDEREVEKLLEERLVARKSGNYQLSDSIRDKLNSMGVEVRDTPEGQLWDIS